MADASPSPYFEFGGNRYAVTVTLQRKDEEEGKDVVTMLRNDMIERLEFLNSLNELVMTGSVVYSDDQAEISKFEHYGRVVCTVAFQKYKLKSDGEYQLDTEDKTLNIVHVFLVNGISILGVGTRRGIKYRLDLVSLHVLQCLSNIDYSNYSDSGKGEAITNIFKQLLSKVGLKTDSGLPESTFDSNGSGVELSYITNGNDNLFTTTEYLFGKTYYGDVTDETPKFFLYDEHNNFFRIFDISVPNTYTGLFSETIPLMGSTMKGMFSQLKHQLASKDSVKFTDVYKSIVDRNIYSYSLEDNTFNSTVFPSKQITNYYNSVETKEFPGIYLPQLDCEYKYRMRGSYWNNNINVYRDFVDNFFRNNTMVLACDGNILRLPGSITAISTDNFADFEGYSDPKIKEEFKRKYENLIGKWYTIAVRHVICPAKQTYRNVLTLSRNWMNKIKDS